MGHSDGKTTCSIISFARKLGLNDSRRIIHSLKVGLALTLASLLVLLKDPYHWIGQNAIWAVITVVVVFESSAGATLGKGLNRGLGTVLAGLLALGVAHLADLLQATGEPIFIGAMVFLSGLVCTFIRAIPTVKKKFDYGVMIFMLTFCMVLVTGYRTGDEVRRATDRLLTIMIGGLISLAVSSFFFPHWAGKDLHRLTADNFDKLGNALEECVKEYLRGEAQPITSEMIAEDADSVYNTCREAVKSRSTEEALVVFASWEPPHGRFRLGYPWKQYLTVGAMVRHCAYSVLALHGCLRSEIQAPSGLRMIFATEMLTASQEGADVLHDLAACIRDMNKPKASTEDLLRKTSRAAEAIKESISKHSYLLATPESWASLDDSLNEHIGGAKKSSTVENETVMSDGRLATSNRIKPKKEALLATSPRLQTLLEHDVALSESGNREAALSSPDRMMHLSGNAYGEQSSDRNRVEDIARAASLISFASLLIETLARLSHLVKAVQRLSQVGRFRGCTCRSNRVHVEEHCIYVRDGDFKLTVHPRLDKEPSKNSKSQKSKNSFLPTNPSLEAAE
ncbi:unnamed protein product [Calypogeia fissa]